MTYLEGIRPLVRRIRSPFLVITLAFLVMCGTVFAGSATWNANPNSGDWNTAANWTPATVPNGPSDTATFQSSNTTSLSLSANTEVTGITFDAGASAFSIAVVPSTTLTIVGTGVTNNSGVGQNFVTEVQGSVEGGIILPTTRPPAT